MLGTMLWDCRQWAHARASGALTDGPVVVTTAPGPAVMHDRQRRVTKNSLEAFGALLMRKMRPCCFLNSGRQR